MAVMTYTGAPIEVRIADQTDPWVEVEGVRATAEQLEGVRPINFHCENQCQSGVLIGCNDDFGIQRCDVCAVFDGDLSAALALAVEVRGIVRFEVE